MYLFYISSLSISAALLIFKNYWQLWIVMEKSMLLVFPRRNAREVETILMAYVKNYE